MTARLLSFLTLVALAACKPAADSNVPAVEEKDSSKAQAATKPPTATTVKPSAKKASIFKAEDHPALDEQTAQGVKFALSNYSNQPREQDGTFSQRVSRELMPDERLRVQAALLKLRDGKLPAAELKQLLDGLADVASVELLQLATELMKHADTTARGAALALFAGMSDEETLPLAKQGLADADPSVRLQAAELLTHVQSPELKAVLKTGLQDPDANVRLVTFQTALRQPAKQRQELMDAAVTQPHPDLAQAAIDTLESEPSKLGMNTLMKGLDHPDAFIKEKTRDIIALTVGEIFENSAAAKSWWQQNHSRFDEDLVQSTDP